MTQTRIIESNFAHSDVNELDSYSGPGHYVTHSGSGNISATKVRGGIYGKSFRVTASDAPRGKIIIGGATAVVAGYFLNHNGMANASSRVHLWMLPIGSSFASIDWENATNDIILTINGVEVARANGAGLLLTTVDKWYHIGLQLKAHATTGYLSLYVDGIKIATFTGNTAPAGSVNGVFFSGTAINVGQWNNYAYFSCFYLYRTDEGDTVPIGHEFFFLPLASAGFYQGNWSAVGAATSLACVAVPANGDTNYIEAGSAGLKESWVITAPPVNFLPAGYTITGAIPSTVSRRTGTQLTTLKLGLRTSGGAEQNGTVEQALMIGYSEANDMFELNDVGGAWTLPQFTGLEVVVESAGAF